MCNYSHTLYQVARKILAGTTSQKNWIHACRLGVLNTPPVPVAGRRSYYTALSRTAGPASADTIAPRQRGSAGFTEPPSLSSSVFQPAATDFPADHPLETGFAGLTRATRTIKLTNTKLNWRKWVR
ncbi:MAG: hypothetical protein CSA09_03295 [Candidatus Contendobacter odensis]|uniref:Uncharacterized protein n=1 Tax=Candidatus Contendibacter odensensis TaxID=1400860 RepID=A0A2G6PEY3_9GAMM|nr:MAG: hypothetical protein CSA09_03295 [Candidatus Contendobacter odensis]